MEDFEEIQRMVGSDDVKKSIKAVYHIHSTIEKIENKVQAWKDLIALTNNEHGDVRWRVVEALGSAFQHHTKKEQAWKVDSTNK